MSLVTGAISITYRLRITDNSAIIRNLVLYCISLHLHCNLYNEVWTIERHCSTAQLMNSCLVQSIPFAANVFSHFLITQLLSSSK